MYPSCLACANAKRLCQWKRSVIHLRLSNLPTKAKNCEQCVRSKDGCHFIWEGSKRPAESSIDPASPAKRIKIESTSLDLSLERIDNHLGCLVKLATKQALQSTQDHKSSSAMFETITDSLASLHQKSNRG